MTRIIRLKSFLEEFQRKHPWIQKGEKGSVAIFFAILFPALMWLMIYFETRMEVLYVTQEVQSILDISTTGAASAGVVYQSGNSRPFCTIPFRDADNENGDQVAVKLLQYNIKALPIYVRNPIVRAINDNKIEGLKDSEEYAGGYSKLDLEFSYRPRISYFFNTYKIHVKSRAKCQADPDWEPESQEKKCSGPILTPSGGTIEGPSGKETYYNLDMKGVVAIMRNIGNVDQYWIRKDGVKMLGDYVMVAADLNLRPRGSLVETSLGTGIVCDTGSFIEQNPKQLDIAVDWGSGTQYESPYNPDCNGVGKPTAENTKQLIENTKAPSVEELRSLAQSKLGMSARDFDVAYGWIAGGETSGNANDAYADYLSACAGINRVKKWGAEKEMSIRSGWGPYYYEGAMQNHIRDFGQTEYCRKLMYLAITQLDNRPIGASGMSYRENGTGVWSVNDPEVIYKVRYFANDLKREIWFVVDKRG